jgi:starch synthase
MPSHYEPCGLSQMISMAYGTVPVVRATGGLADTVKDFNDAQTGELQKNSATGFSFTEYHSKALYSALERALFTFENKKIWSKLMDNCFAQDFSWDESAKKYAELYTIAEEKINKTSR